MGTQKRERQKLNRNLKLEEIAKVNLAAARKRKVIRWSSIIGAAVVAIILIAVLSKRSDKTVTTATVPTTPATVAPSSAASTAPASTVVAGPFQYGTGECAAADGSSAKTTTFTNPPKLCIDPAKTYSATVETTKGSYTAVLDAKKAPGTVNNFVNLARFHYFDSTPCHRIVKGFMAQCGDPTGKGTGGPGYTIPDELPATSADYQPGTLAMANSGPNTNGSQYFTMFRVGLAPSYSIFGHVTEGMDTTIKALDAVGNPADGAPTEPVSITKVTIAER